MNAWNLRTAIGNTGSAIINTFVKIMKLSNKDNPCESINEVLIYGDEDEEKKEQIGLNNLLCIYYVIIHASRSVDVCLPNLVSDTITKCLISVQEKNGATIRVVIHDNEDMINLRKLTENKIAVKVINSAVKLEHEFVLVDTNDTTDAVAVIGSIDFEPSRVNCNRDTTILTSEFNVVTALKREFDRIWNSQPIILRNNE